MSTSLHELPAMDLEPLGRCAKCGYDLTGLRPGAKCPECGQPGVARRGRRWLDDNLTDAPTLYLRRFVLGCALLAVGGVSASILWQLTIQLVQSASGPLINALMAGAAAIWIAGVWIVTSPRQSTRPLKIDLEKEWRRLRWTGRLTQLSWLLFAAAAFIGIMAYRQAMATAAQTSPTAWGIPLPRLTQLMLGAAAVLYIIGVAGLVPLSVHFSFLSDWASDTGLGDRFRVAAWSLCFGLLSSFGGYVVVRLGLGSTVSVFGGLFALLGNVLHLTGGLLFLWSLIQLARMAQWALSYSGRAMDRDVRIIERMSREAREEAERFERATKPQHAAHRVTEDDAATRISEKDIYQVAPEAEEKGPRRG